MPPELAELADAPGALPPLTKTTRQPNALCQSLGYADASPRASIKIPVAVRDLSLVNC